MIGGRFTTTSFFFFFPVLNFSIAFSLDFGTDALLAECRLAFVFGTWEVSFT